MPNTLKIKEISVNTDQLRQQERFDFLNDVYAREGLILAPRRPIGTSVSAGTRLWQVGEAKLALTYSSGHIGKRIRDKGALFLGIRKHKTGGCHSWSDDGYFATQAGDILLTVNTVDGLHACRDLDTVNLVLPAELFEIDYSAFQTTQILPAASIGNRLISAAMEAWVAELDHPTGRDPSSIERDMVSLVNHVLSHAVPTQDSDESVAQFRGDAMRRYLDENLLSDEINAAELSKLFGASRASVYREFASDGGVRRYIAKKRLTRALFLLQKTPARRGVIGWIGLEVGFSDPLLFSRAFKEHFGFTPSDVLGVLEVPTGGTAESA